MYPLDDVVVSAHTHTHTHSQPPASAASTAGELPVSKQNLQTRGRIKGQRDSPDTSPN